MVNYFVSVVNYTIKDINVHCYVKKVAKKWTSTVSGVTDIKHQRQI